MTIVQDAKPTDTLSDSSQKLSQIERIASLSASDIFVLDRITRGDKANVVILDELEKDAAELECIIALEDNFDTFSEGKFLLNEVQRSISYIKLFNSHKVSYGILSDYLEVSSTVSGLGTMSMRDKSEYSKYDHSHGDSYSLTQVFPIQKSGDPLATFDISNSEGSKSITIYQPHADVVESRKYSIGEIKLIARANYDAIDINSSQFDGFVYADGKTYSKSDFPSAWQTFSSGRTATQFKVPVMEHFIKLVNSVDTNVNGQKVDFYNYMPAHKHEDINNIQIHNYTKSIEIDVKMVGNNVGSGTSGVAKAVHTGYTKHEDNDKYRLQHLSIDLGDQSIASYATVTKDMPSEVESKPKHYRIPCLIYIGKRGE